MSLLFEKFPVHDWTKAYIPSDSKQTLSIRTGKRQIKPSQLQYNESGTIVLSTIRIPTRNEIHIKCLPRRGAKRQIMK